jgi:hypothetical protein
VEQRNQIETTGVINITEQEQLCKHDFAGWFLDPKGKIPIKQKLQTRGDATRAGEHRAIRCSTPAQFSALDLNQMNLRWIDDRKPEHFDFKRN